MADTALTRLEKAVAAHIRGHRDANADDPNFAGDIDQACTRTGDLNGLPVHEGRQAERAQSPYIAVRGTGAREPYQDSTMRECTVDVVLYVSRREDEDDTEKAEVLFQARSRALEDLLVDYGALQLAINKPAGGVDSRAVTGIHMQDAWLSANNLAADSDHWEETFEITAIAYPFDHS